MAEHLPYNAEPALSVLSFGARDRNPGQCNWCEWSGSNRQAFLSAAGFKPAEFTYFSTLAINRFNLS